MAYGVWAMVLVNPVFAASSQPTSCPPNSADCAAGLPQLEAVFRNFISVFVAIGFVALFIMIVFAGYKYLMSGGEPKAVSQAHQTVTWAILGIIFMAVAWIVLQIIKTFTGVDVTTFSPGILTK